jgi:hypothetical protein
LRSSRDKLYRSSSSSSGSSRRRRRGEDKWNRSSRDPGREPKRSTTRVDDDWDF